MFFYDELLYSMIHYPSPRHKELAHRVMFSGPEWMLML